MTYHSAMRITQQRVQPHTDCKRSHKNIAKTTTPLIIQYAINTIRVVLTLNHSAHQSIAKHVQ